jgi:anaerobic selenocysteine-containing dehydrogenase
MNTNLTRRKFLKTAGFALVLIPLVAISRQAGANTNSNVRTQLKYQNSPKDNMSCTTCLEFIPGKTDKDLGRCKVIPEDDEISPNGYCTKWNTM